MPLDATAQDGDTVVVHYTVTLDDGRVVDSSRQRGKPFSFRVGAGEVIAGFDAAVRGMALGESKTVRFDPDQAYGDRDERRVIKLPIDQGPKDLSVGDRVEIGGRDVTVAAVDDATITLDANHPLAGQALTFAIEIVELR